MDLTRQRPVPRINIEVDASTHLSLGKVRDALASTKCKLCQKMEFHCRNCQHRCHKKCPGHTHQCIRKNHRRSGHSKIYAGDEHWTKVLQANEVIGEVSPCPYHCRSRRSDPSSSSISDRLPNGDCPVRSPPLGTSKDPSSGTGVSLKDKTFLHTIYSRFCQWIDSTRKDNNTTTLSRLRSTSPRNSRRSSCEGGEVGKTALSPGATAGEMVFDLAALLAEKAASVNDHYGRALSSSDSELGSAGGASYSSTCSSLTVTSTSTTTSDCCPSCGAGGGGASPAQMSDCSNLDDGFLSDDVAGSGSPVCETCAGGGGCRQVRTEQFLTAGMGIMNRDWQSSADENRWYTASLDRDECDERDRFDENHPSYYEEYLRDSLVDWNIPISDVQLVECLRKGVKHDVFRGRWHGDVFIYSFNRSLEVDYGLAKFLTEVTRLSKIRHENICLFMGACLQPPNLAIITSGLKGISVYEKLHLSSDRIPMRSRVNIGRQVAQAMGYLHAKSIVAQVLNSKNIYLEPKVKLSLLDQGMAEIENNRLHEVCVPRGNLTYLAPEILRDLRVNQANAASTDAYVTTVHTDVFAFGTLLYELFSGQFPFRGLRLEEILWQVCTGSRQTLTNISCNVVLKVLIERCWSAEPQHRPPFSEINQELQQKTGLHKRHSSSQPERLDRQNSFSDKCLL